MRRGKGEKKGKKRSINPSNGNISNSNIPQAWCETVCFNTAEKFLARCVAGRTEKTGGGLNEDEKIMPPERSVINE